MRQSGRVRRDAKGSRRQDGEPLLLARAGRARAAEGRTEQHLLHGDRRRREVRRAMRRRYSRPSRLPRPRACRLSRGASRPACRPRWSMPSPASSCCASSRAAPSTRKTSRANVGRIVPLLQDMPRHGRTASARPRNAFWVFHVIRDYAHLLGDEARYLAIADRARGGCRSRCRSCSAITICCPAISSMMAAGCG